MNARQGDHVDNPSDEFDLILDQISDRIHAGESIDLSSLIEAHPKHATRLKQLVPAMQAIAELGSRSDAPRRKPADPTNPRQATDVVDGVLGDFRIIQEIGRGGMGVVYEAQQISLRRRVALKMLPFAAVLDDRQLQRFQNEAQAAAMLRHDNIVGVHSVGCDRGVHYYAMDLIQGQSVAQTVQQLRTRSDNAAEPSGSSPQESREPSTNDLSEEERRANDETQPLAALSTKCGVKDQEYFRAVARLTIQAANALEYAHQRGVIHRDIKPSNLLLDSRGKLCVADFGLAIIQGDSNLTLTGDVLGTLRYMSPEQAAGRKYVDQRTDVYSLGITLYELLTLRPAFAADDRQQLLREVIEDQPPLPRRLNPKIPNDLETIALKATAKDLDSRYETAQQFADDLERFLEHRPIRARRARRVEHLWRWSKRNPAIAGLLVATAALLLLLGVGGPTLALRQTQLANDLQKKEQQQKHQLYATRMNIAHQAVKDGEYDRANDLLRMYISHTDDGEDLRDFEWFYLWRITQEGLRAPTIRHWISIWCAQFSPDGQTVAIGTWDGSVLLCDPFTQHIARTLGTRQQGALPYVGDAHQGWVHSLSFSPSGSILATAGGQSTVKFWDVENGQLINQLGPFPLRVVRVAFSPDGTMLALGFSSADDVGRPQRDRPGEIRLYRYDHEPESRELRPVEIGVMTSDFNTVSSLSFSPNNTLLAASCDDSSVRIWDTATREERRRIRADDPVYCVAFSPDGNTLAGGTGSYHEEWLAGQVQLWDVHSGALIDSLQGHTARVQCMAFSQDGTQLASASFDRTVKLWNIPRGELAGTIRGHSNAVRAVSFSADGKHLATASEDGSLKFWSLEELPQRTNRIDEDVICMEVDFSPDGQLLATGGLDRAVKLWNLKSGLLASKPLKLRHFLFSLAISPDGGRLATGGGMYPQVHQTELKLWDVATGQLRHELSGHTGCVYSVAFSPNGKMLASGGTDAIIRLWDVATGQLLDKLPGHESHVRRLKFSEDGSTLVSISSDGVKLWDVVRRKCRKTIIHDYVMPLSLDISPDSQTIAAAGGRPRDGSGIALITLWSASDGSVKEVLRGHSDSVWYLDFSPNGKRLVSASFDTTVKIWDPINGTDLITFRESPKQVFCAKFSPDGSTLVAGTTAAGPDRTVYLWHAPRGGFNVMRQVSP